MLSFSTSHAINADNGGTRKNKADTLVASLRLIIINNRLMASIELKITRYASASKNGTVIFTDIGSNINANGSVKINPVAY